MHMACLCSTSASFTIGRRALFLQWEVACALPSQYGLTARPPRAPAALGRDEAWDLATNDQFGLSLQITPTWAQRRLLNLSRLVLPQRFNWRENARRRAGEEVVVRHEPAHKMKAMQRLARARAEL